MRSFGLVRGLATTAAVVGAALVPVAAAPAFAVAAASDCNFSVVSSPNASNLRNSLNAVAVLSASDAWAVGSYATAGNAFTATLVEHWDGTGWRVVPSPTGSPRRTGTRSTCSTASRPWRRTTFGRSATP